MSIKLLGFKLSGHAHRAELFLSLLGLDFEYVEVDLKNGEHKSEAFLKMNPMGQVPALIDGDTVIADSNAILVYIAEKYAQGSHWYPAGLAKRAQIQQFLSLAANQVANGVGAARLITLFGAGLDKDVALSKAHALLEVTEGLLENQHFLTGSEPTIADVAFFSYIDRSPEGNVDLSGYANVNAWLERVKALPGFVAMPVSPVGLLAS